MASDRLSNSFTLMYLIRKVLASLSSSLSFLTISGIRYKDDVLSNPREYRGPVLRIRICVRLYSYMEMFDVCEFLILIRAVKNLGFKTFFSFSNLCD